MVRQFAEIAPDPLLSEAVELMKRVVTADDVSAFVRPGNTGEAMTSDVLLLQQQSSAAEALALINRHCAGATCVVVVNNLADRQPLGLFTEHEALRLLNNQQSLENTPLTDAMTPLPTTASIELSLQDAVLRMKEHQNNAFAVARFLEQHPGIEAVHYPGLTSHPQYDLACEQMKGFGGVVACVVKGGIDSAKNVVSNTKLFQLAESLGGVKSLICHPASMTHAPIPKEVREPLGIVDGLIRLSVGIEEAEDLIKDLDSVLPRAKTFAVPTNQKQLVTA